MPAGTDVTLPIPLRTTVSCGWPPPPTVSVALPVWPLNAAVIVAEPGARPVARPAASIVATVELLLVQVALIPTTVAGVCVSAVVPVPSSPYVFMPQQRTRPP